MVSIGTLLNNILHIIYARITYISILKYRAERNLFLKSILEDENQHIKYLSHDIQNQIIDISNR